MRLPLLGRNPSRTSYQQNRAGVSTTGTQIGPSHSESVDYGDDNGDSPASSYVQSRANGTHLNASVSEQDLSSDSAADYYSDYTDFTMSNGETDTEDEQGSTTSHRESSFPHASDQLVPRQPDLAPSSIDSDEHAFTMSSSEIGQASPLGVVKKRSPVPQPLKLPTSGTIDRSSHDNLSDARAQVQTEGPSRPSTRRTSSVAQTPRAAIHPLPSMEAELSSMPSAPLKASTSGEVAFMTPFYSATSLAHMTDYFNLPSPASSSSAYIVPSPHQERGVLLMAHQAEHLEGATPRAAEFPLHQRTISVASIADNRAQDAKPSLYKQLQASRSLVNLSSPTTRRMDNLPSAEPTPTQTFFEVESQLRRRSLADLLSPSTGSFASSLLPPYSTIYGRSHGKQRILPRDEEGQESLPLYHCAVHIEGWLPRKMEFTAPGIQAVKRSWKRLYAVLHGTSIKFYKRVPHTQPIDYAQDFVASPAMSQSSSSWSLSESAAENSPVHFHVPPSSGRSSTISSPFARANIFSSHTDRDEPIATYSLQHAESGLAADYLRRKNVIRIRAEGEQFLLQMQEVKDVVDWIEVSFTCIFFVLK